MHSMPPVRRKNNNRVVIVYVNIIHGHVGSEGYAIFARVLLLGFCGGNVEFVAFFLEAVVRVDEF
jgi:hypothetical protein